MLKYLSYLNLFLGIIFIALAKNNGDYLDLALLLPTVFFNWLTLFHLLRNDQKFEKWHLYVGILSTFFAIATILIMLQSLFTFLSREVMGNFPTFIIATRIIFGMLIIYQFVVAFKASKKLATKL
ncbi:hypothetical protein [Pedobacter sandarakinus]|uniref:hypothetical protein n=1 Tax=Pedobacter sandarakinus TaxID=353156 RepID=UPI0022465068|nr:hypothetical protein [Pedobacter sandarakinus]MCX2575338.1 hypothetical protein [Pedobacter sandarakinus]